MWDSFGVGHTQNLILLHMWLDQHFRPLVCWFIFSLYPDRLKMCSKAKFFHILSNSYNTLALCWLYMVADLAKQVYNWGCIEENFLRHFNIFILSAHGGFIKGGQYPMNLRAFINFTFFVQKQCSNTAELREWDYTPEPTAFAIKLLELLSFQFC